MKLEPFWFSEITEPTWFYLYCVHILIQVQDLPMAELLTILKQDYSRKNEKNPNYSLRSYARWMGLNHTSLSLFLNGKRGLSLGARKKIVSRLGISPESSGAILNREAFSKPLFSEVDLEKLHIISDWFYFGILSLMETKGFKEDPSWIAKRLNISSVQAETALKKLEKMGLGVRSKKGHLEASGINFKTPDQISSIALRRTHYQALELAKSSLDRHPVQIRDFSAMTMAIDPERIPEAKRRVKNFRRRLCKYLEGGNKKEVYRLAIQLFPLSEVH